ncbi:MAG: radical SAM protein [Desulfurococcaceae archaeon]|jgi:putative pyruvate formate lyase activating enzyme|nr:radical SAM protein [Desulfurococcaceae archaeon]MCC6053014.1 radical SAM protein [Desulfurococcaceae archaeon]
MEWITTLLSIRPDAISVWSHPEVKERLSWYYRVMRNEMPAKFQIAKRVPVEADLFSQDLSLRDLWSLHEESSRIFRDYFVAVKKGEINIERLERPKHSYLDVKVAIAYRLMSPCRLCERSCGALRLEGKPGVCLVDKDAIVHSYFHHMGEEAPLVPSGTIFYGGCNFKCAFCQNYDISQVMARSGERLSPRELASIQVYLRRRGARNINHVGGEPTPHLPFILDSLRYLDVSVPQLWNSNMYMSLDSMILLEDVIDIWLPDLKYGNNDCAWRLSKVRNYWEVTTRNIKRAHEAGDMIIRHLVMPNHIECCTRPVLEWIAKNTPRALVNIMDQYRPEHLVAKYPKMYPDISRRPTQSEMSEAYKIARELGIVFEPVS